MIQVSGNRIQVSGAMNMAGATAMLAEGEAALIGLSLNSTSSVEFELGAVTEMDSSCLAVIFGWMRKAQSAGAKVKLLNTPANLLSLAAVYDVVELLPTE